MLPVLKFTLCGQSQTYSVKLHEFVSSTGTLRECSSGLIYYLECLIILLCITNYVKCSVLQVNLLICLDKHKSYKLMMVMTKAVYQKECKLLSFKISILVAKPKRYCFFSKAELVTECVQSVLQ